MSCGVGHRHGSHLAWLWLWYRLVATALIGPPAWEPPHAVGTALEETKRQKKKKKKEETRTFYSSTHILNTHRDTNWAKMCKFLTASESTKFLQNTTYLINLLAVTWKEASVPFLGNRGQ